MVKSLMFWLIGVNKPCVFRGQRLRKRGVYVLNNVLPTELAVDANLGYSVISVLFFSDLCTFPREMWTFPTYVSCFCRHSTFTSCKTHTCCLNLTYSQYSLCSLVA